MSYGAVATAVKKSKEGNFKTKCRSGRPMSLTKKDESFICRKVIENPFQTSNELCKQINLIPGKEKISAVTIRRMLKRNNFISYVSKKKPLVTKRMAKKRFDWCKVHRNKSIDFWRCILFSDETIIQINNTSLMNRCRRFPWSDPFNPLYIRPKVKCEGLLFWEIKAKAEVCQWNKE